MSLSPIPRPSARSRSVERSGPPLRPLTTGRGIDLRALANVLCQIGQVERLDDLGRRARCSRRRAPAACFTACSAATPSEWRSTCWTTSRASPRRRCWSWRPSRASGTIPARRRSRRSSTSTGSPTTRSGPSWRSCGPSRTTARSTARRNVSSCWRRTPPASATRSSTRRSSIASDARSPCSTACGRRCAGSSAAWMTRRRRLPLGPGGLARRDRQPGLGGLSDSYYHADGTLFDVAQPYAPAAVQGYAYDALLGVAEILEGRGARGKGRGGRTQERARIEQCWATELRARAADLRSGSCASSGRPISGRSRWR